MEKADEIEVRESRGLVDWINISDGERLLSIAAGGVLAYLGLRRGNGVGATIVAGGAALLLRGLSGFCPVNEAMGRDTSTRSRSIRPLDLQSTVTVNAPRDEVMAFWRQLENLPRFMKHLLEVRELGEGRSHWVAEVPGGLGTVAWDAEMKTGADRIAWHSVPGSLIENTGEVTFRDAPGSRGTEVRARISYRPPAGRVGRSASKLLTPVFNQLVREDIRRFKHVMEAGEVPVAQMHQE